MQRSFCSANEPTNASPAAAPNDLALMNNELLIQTNQAEATLDAETLVERHYEALYRFAVALSGNANDAADLTQDTFHVLLVKGGQIRDPQKAKTWLFTTLYRRFLGQRRRASLRPEVSLETAESELPVLDAQGIEALDGSAVRSALFDLPENYRAPLAMFYLQQLSYREIAEVLGVPIGTVMSRLSRGKQLLRRQLQGALRPQPRQATGRPDQPLGARRQDSAAGLLRDFGVAGSRCFAAC